MEQYVKPYSDIFVKYLFGSPGHEEILISFINDVLSESGFAKIESVEIQNPFTLQEFVRDKLSILDVRARDEKGKTFHIEIQSEGNESHKARILYYWAKLYSSQLQEGDPYVFLRPVISINVVNFPLIKESEDYHSWFSLTKNGNSDIVLTDHLLIHFLELPHIVKRPPERLNHLERWGYFLKNEGLEDDMKIIIKDDEVFQKAHKAYERFTQDDRMRALYDSRVEAERAHLTDLILAEERGVEKTARAMLSDGADIELIAKYTGLSESEIIHLREGN